MDSVINQHNIDSIVANPNQWAGNLCLEYLRRFHPDEVEDVSQLLELQIRIVDGDQRGIGTRDQRFDLTDGVAATVGGFVLAVVGSLVAQLLIEFSKRRFNPIKLRFRRQRGWTCRDLHFISEKVKTVVTISDEKTTIEYERIFSQFVEHVKTRHE